MLSRKTLLRIFSYALFLLLAPFAIELVIMADIIGVEAAIAFLFFYGKSVAIVAKQKVFTGCKIFRAFFAKTPDEVLLTHERYINGVAYSFVGFGIAGSLIMSVLAYVPAVASALQL